MPEIENELPEGDERPEADPGEVDDPTLEEPGVGGLQGPLDDPEGGSHQHGVPTDL